MTNIVLLSKNWMRLGKLSPDCTSNASTVSRFFLTFSKLQGQKFESISGCRAA